jgi:hypothetical protein
MTRARLLVVLIASGCAASPPPRSAAPAAPVSSASGPEWFRTGDRTTGKGSTFVCQGEGASEEASLAAAQGICSDKVCKVCGVEVESVVQTTETLKGVEMKRKVVERCRRFRKAEPKVLHKTSDCGPGGCVTWLSVSFSKQDEKQECPVYASEHFADPVECQRLIQAFRNTQGRTAASFRARAQLLGDGLAACKDIDVRPTPLVDALHEQLFAGMAGFEVQTDGRRVAPEKHYLITSEPLHQHIRETPTLVGRIRLVRDYVANRALVFDVIEAASAGDLDSPGGVTRLLAALKAAPVGGQYGTFDVHFYGVYDLGGLRSDVTAIARFYRASYPPESLDPGIGQAVATLLGKDGKVDEAEWQYIFELHKHHSCPGCVGKLIEVVDHGGAQVRDARFQTWLDHDLQEAGGGGGRKQVVAWLMPQDPVYMLHLRALLPADVRATLDWDFYIRRLDKAVEDDDPVTAAKLLPLLGQALADRPAAAVDHNYCLSLGERLNLLASRRAPPAPVGDQICACLTGPMAGQGTRNSSNKSELYDHALARALPCVRPQ